MTYLEPMDKAEQQNSLHIGYMVEMYLWKCGCVVEDDDDEEKQNTGGIRAGGGQNATSIQRSSFWWRTERHFQRHAGNSKSWRSRSANQRCRPCTLKLLAVFGHGDGFTFLPAIGGAIAQNFHFFRRARSAPQIHHCSHDPILPVDHSLFDVANMRPRAAGLGLSVPPIPSRSRTCQDYAIAAKGSACNKLASSVRGPIAH